MEGSKPEVVSGQHAASGSEDTVEGKESNGKDLKNLPNIGDLRGGPRLIGHIGKWSSLFGVKPKGKSSLPLVKNTLSVSQGKFAISIPDQIIDHNIVRMENTLIGKFYGMKPNIEVVCGFVKRKWNMKGQVDVVAMNKGCLSFSFSCEEDHRNILCNDTWAIGKYLMYI